MFLPARIMRRRCCSAKEEDQTPLSGRHAKQVELPLFADAAHACPYHKAHCQPHGLAGQQTRLISSSS